MVLSKVTIEKKVLLDSQSGQKWDDSSGIISFYVFSSRSVRKNSQMIVFIEIFVFVFCFISFLFPSVDS